MTAAVTAAPVSTWARVAPSWCARFRPEKAGHVDERTGIYCATCGRAEPAHSTP